jgi:hypothetical protein
MTSLTVNRKTTNTYTITFTRNGVAENITGWTVFFTVKKNTSQTDALALISKTITSHTNPTLGITTITLSPTDTDITAGNYLYDIVYVDDVGNRYSTVPDTFTILDYVTIRSA